jgi:hypothetical protein
MQDTATIQTTRDAISWVAHYGGGNVINQYDGETKHFYEELERNDLIRFDLVKDDQVICSVICDDRPELLFWRKRGYIDLKSGAELPCHIVGKKGEFVALVFPDGRVMMRHNFVADDVYFDEPSPVKGEAWQT